MNGLRLFRPDAASDPAEPLLRTAIHAYLDHMSLLVEAGASRAAFDNTRRALLRFEAAWSVTLADGRHVLVPIAEPKRKPPLRYQATLPEEALAVAAKLAPQPLPEAVGAAPIVRRNGDRSLAEVSNDDLVRWVLANPQWQSGHSKSGNLTCLYNCFAWFADEHDLKNPFKRKRIPSFEKEERREATDAEYIALMGHRSSRPLRRALWCLYNLDGIRPGEMRVMLKKDFNWDGAEGEGEGFIVLKRHKTSRKTKKPRLWVFTPRQSRFFRNVLRSRVPAPGEHKCDCERAAHEPHLPSDHVFCNTDGNAWDRHTFARHLRRTCVRIGLDQGVAARISAYCFRHTFATQADEAGLPEQETAMLLGHGNTKMLREVYSKASRKIRHIRSAAEKAETLRAEARRARSRAARAAQGKPEAPAPLFDGLED